MDNEVNEGECILESVVYYVDPKSPGSLGFLGGKERIRIPVLSAHSSFEAFKRHIIEHAGLKTEAEKRGLRPCIDLKLCRLVKTQEGSKAYSINTQAQWDAERPLFVSSAVLQVNVLKKEVAFAKESPITKITVANGNDASLSQSNISREVKGRRKPGGSRKRSAANLDDDDLVKRLKKGENVTRSERQVKMMEDLNQGTCTLS
ncbi:hypothetical protein OS493_011476 [Desmophyllum pertusum]|uniref:Uncharacterized protein n=1 Tax=Desmophyllum pertusum TaxID=174260 RepID=A0A9W9YQH6_9CNID|nr:hypothetical protein OS493_011476 [Desmophyllum pertusum]